LYVAGELIGGSDIIEQMLNSGELHEVLGVAAPDRTPPTLHISPAAAEAIRRAMDDSEPGIGLHLSVDPRFAAQFQLKPVTGQNAEVEASGCTDVPARRGKQHQHDWVDVRGSGLISNCAAAGEVMTAGTA
jgi:monothiol glutaredoxin